MTEMYVIVFETRSGLQVEKINKRKWRKLIAMTCTIHQSGQVKIYIAHNSHIATNTALSTVTQSIHDEQAERQQQREKYGILEPIRERMSND